MTISFPNSFASATSATGAQLDANFSAINTNLNAANGLIQLNGSAQIPALDGSLLTNLPSSAVAATVGAFRNLAASSTGLSANVSVTADEIVVENSSNAYVTLRSVSLTIAGTSVGANALDAGTIAASTWYSVWVIYNGTTTAGLLSTSATAPTMPGGYTHKARVGWIRTDASGNKYPLSFKQVGRSVQYVIAAGSNVAALPSPISGVQGTIQATSGSSTLVAGSLTNFTPTTAAKIRGLLTIPINGAAFVAPSAGGWNGYSGTTMSTVPSVGVSTGGNVSVNHSIPFEFVLETANVYYASSIASGAVWVLGWEDNL